MKTQEEMILKHLMKGKKITPLSALKLYGCMRLASRINELKNIGVNIKKEMQYIRNCKGHITSKYMEYWL